MKTTLYHGDIAFCMIKISNNFQKNILMRQKKSVYLLNNTIRIYFLLYHTSHSLAHEEYKQGREVVISSFKLLYTI